MFVSYPSGSHLWNDLSWSSGSLCAYVRTGDAGHRYTFLTCIIIVINQCLTRLFGGNRYEFKSAIPYSHLSNIVLLVMSSSCLFWLCLYCHYAFYQVQKHHLNGIVPTLLPNYWLSSDNCPILFILNNWTCKKVDHFVPMLFSSKALSCNARLYVLSNLTVYGWWSYMLISKSYTHFKVWTLNCCFYH